MDGVLYQYLNLLSMISDAQKNGNWQSVGEAGEILYARLLKHFAQYGECIKTPLDELPREFYEELLFGTANAKKLKKSREQDL